MMFKVRDSQAGMDGNAVMIAPTIIRNIVPGVNREEMKKNNWYNIYSL